MVERLDAFRQPLSMAVCYGEVPVAQLPRDLDMATPPAFTPLCSRCAYARVSDRAAPSVQTFLCFPLCRDSDPQRHPLVGGHAGSKRYLHLHETRCRMRCQTCARLDVARSVGEETTRHLGRTHSHPQVWRCHATWWCEDTVGRVAASEIARWLAIT